MEAANQSASTWGLRRWFGQSAFVAAGVFLAGRVAVEPLRDAPQFDAKGMEAYAAVETFALRRNPHPISVALFGSSVSIWGVLADQVADELQLPHEQVSKLAVVGGTPFDHWNLIRRNPEKFSALRAAAIEINPRMLHPDMESDERVRFTISQHATWRERMELYRHHERTWQRLEIALPLQSVRRSLRSAFLNVVQPVHGTPVYPKPEARLFPFHDWHVPGGGKPHFRDTVPPHTAARRLVGNWRLSKLQDQCLRQTLAWLNEHGVRVILYQLPVHPAVAQHIRENEAFAAGFAKFNAYVATLGVPSADFIQSLDIASCGVPLAGMRDHTHFNEIGAKAYSPWLGARLRERLATPGTNQ